MSENLPIIWDDKINSPELLAYFQQFGKNTYVSAEELNQIRDAINELSFPNGFIKTSPLTRVDNEISIDPFDFKWILNKLIIENEDSYSTTINPAVDGYHRKDIIVANETGGFDKVEGDEDVDIALRPDIPENTLLVSEIDVFGATVIGSTSPVVTNFVEKAESEEWIIPGGDAYIQFSLPYYSSLRFIGETTFVAGVYLFPGYKAYSGKKLTVKNFQSTDILLKHLATVGAGLINTKFWFDNETDYILKPGKIIEFSLSLSTNRFEFVGNSEDISEKEDVSNKGIANGYVPLNSTIKIAAEYLSIVNDLVTGGETSLASAETVKTLKSQINAINTLLTSDNVNLDTVQEIVDAIETVQISLSTILVNDLTTGGTAKALTAEMGKSLKGLIDTITTTVSGKQASLTDLIFGTFINGLTPKTTPVDADSISIVDSADSNKQKKVSLTNFKAYILNAITSLFARKDRLIENTSVTGAYALDYSSYELWNLTLTGNTTFSESNLEPKTIIIRCTGNYALTFPSGWSSGITGVYNGTLSNVIVVQNFKSGLYKVSIIQPD